jgi:spermidine synthase
LSDPSPESALPVGKWHFELVTTDLMAVYRIRDIVHTGTTQYQTVEILDTHSFGLSLVLDGKTQSTELDEHIYHESLVHPALLFSPRAESVFIGGGGEGATLREVLRYDSVKRVVMLDLDEGVVELCRTHLPGHHDGGFDDGRLELRHEDARQYLATCQESFDVIILDLVDPIEGGPSYMLYTREFYQIAKSKLNPGGILVTQAGPAGFLNYTECLTAIARTISETFPETYPYATYIPAFTTLWGYVLALNEGGPGTDGVRLAEIEPGVVDGLILKRLPRELRYYDGISHRRMFSLPKYLRQGIGAEERIVTDENPVFMV